MATTRRPVYVPPPNVQPILLIILLIVGVGCQAPRLGGIVSRLQANCIVILLDAAAASHFGVYGYGRDTTPTVDALAAEGVVFERAYSQGPSTAVSVPSFFLGLYPHRLRREFHADPTSRRPLFLAERFRLAGFRTAGFSESPFVSRSSAQETSSWFRTDQGFEDFTERKPVEGGPLLVDDALAWLRTHQGTRFYLYLHLLRPHNPYLPPPDIAQRFRPPSYRGTLVADTDTLLAVDAGKRRLAPEELEFLVSQYDANLYYGDQLIRRMVDGLRQLGVLERTVIIVIADHGEAFGQHGRFLHTTTVYEEMIRPPFVVRFPGVAGVRRRRVSQPVGLVDLVPTLVDLFSLPRDQPLATDGMSLVPVMEEPAARLPDRVIYAWSTAAVAVIDGPFKYILTEAGQRDELYHLARDPEERENVSAREPARTNALRALATPTLDAYQPPSPEWVMTEEKRRELRALGYLQ